MTSLTDVLKPGDHGSTFGGNYLSTRAGIEVLYILDEYYKSSQLKETIDYFDSKLLEIAKEFPNFFDKVSGYGLMKALKCHNAEIRDNIVKKAFGDIGNAGGHRSMAKAIIPLKRFKRDYRVSSMKSAFDKIVEIFLHVMEQRC